MTPAELSQLIAQAIADLQNAGQIVLPSEVQIEPIVERPKSRDHGDWATNVALQLAKRAGMAPQDFAQLVAEKLGAARGIEKVDIAGPGFINITLSSAAAGELVQTIVEQGKEFGRGEGLAGQHINVEYVSANPTGPLHIGHTRWAALGDAMVRLLRASGAEVTAEYYINDYGAQMDKFGESILARIRGAEVPEGGYQGQYIIDLGKKVVAEHPEITELPDEEALALAREVGYRLQLAEIQETLAEFGVKFDVWFSETTLHETGAVNQAVERLAEQGHVFDKDGDGARWLRTTTFGDDKDRVLIRSNGIPTYFAADAAYYLSKKDRGFEQKIYLLGADHHGYVARLKAISACAGDDPAKNIEIPIGQLVSVGGAKLSKRAGNIIELRDLVSWIGTDAVRYSLARYPASTPLELDGEQLRKRTNDNPVFYVQYAHARTCNVSRNAAQFGVNRISAFNPQLLTHETETAVLAALGQFPATVQRAAELREPHRVARYLEELAGLYHKWYAECRVTPTAEEGDPQDIHHTRLWLNDAIGQVLANGLDLLGVSAPQRM